MEVTFSEGEPIKLAVGKGSYLYLHKCSDDKPKRYGVTKVNILNSKVGLAVNIVSESITKYFRLKITAIVFYSSLKKEYNLKECDVLASVI